MRSPASTSTMSPLRSCADGTVRHSAASRCGPCELLRRYVLRVAAQRVGLRFAASFGERFGEVREQHGEPQPQRDREDEARPAPRPARAAPGSTATSSAGCRRTRRTSPGCATGARVRASRSVEQRRAHDQRRRRTAERHAACCERSHGVVIVCASLRAEASGARRSGPSASAGTKVSAPTSRTVPISRRRTAAYAWAACRRPPGRSSSPRASPRSRAPGSISQ